MDTMFVKYKDEFVASMNATIDMFLNSLDNMDIKKQHGENIDAEDYNKTKNTIANLQRILSVYKTNGVIAKEDENIVLAAMGTVIIHLEYLADCYKEAAKKAKIIIANINSEN